MSSLRHPATLTVFVFALWTAAAGATSLRLERPIVLLGEVHDHPQQHALRLEAFEALLRSGARPALVMEQLDAARQSELDRLQDESAGADALIAAAGARGWHWPSYRPFIQLALDHRLPIVAVNLSREQSGRIMRDGLAAHGFDPAVPEPVLAELTQLIEDTHCGAVGPELARKMALAQVARDQAMARAVEAHAARGAVLLAGNGHVRNDIGVPRWLPAAVRARTESIGIVEEGDTTTAYDRYVVTPPHPRSDPCAGMRSPPPPASAPAPAAASAPKAATP